ncbi:hypothetical protein MAR_033633 [Mya arenaria]|uniref:Uncharacterized protein n=1 Tax=Mya arenaria TaxID=6604 RepID=A0ABY7GIQ5_MYAAR|nr:uncharacterized protein LOC128223147 [Mya arenaria]WAR31091.1 hypothetical protein MAR_033633 [Mya arenaria]
MSRYQHNNPITQGFSYGNTSQTIKSRRVVDGLPHVCADGHNHATAQEVAQCIDAHKVFVCSSNHMHTERSDAERCDQIKREEDSLKDKEQQRKHEREMMDKQIKMADNLRAMGWNFKVHGMPQLAWKDS